MVAAVAFCLGIGIGPIQQRRDLQRVEVFDPQKMGLGERHGSAPVFARFPLIGAGGAGRQGVRLFHRRTRRHNLGRMDDLGFHDALAMLDWQIELGADEAILDAPVDRFALSDAPPPVAAPASARAPAMPAADAGPLPPAAPSVDAVAVAQAAAAAAHDLPALAAALEGFGLCPLSQMAKSLVFADGMPGARVMIVGEAPGKDEDQIGKPFVGAAGQLLDRMLAAIGLSRQGQDPTQAVYITNMLPWRPPQNRKPEPEELAMMAPFVRRHIELAAPEVVVLMGNSACEGLLGQSGITRMRGQWAEVAGRPALAMFHPAYLLRRPQDKALAWADLLSLKARLGGRT